MWQETKEVEPAGKRTIEGESPVHESFVKPSDILSKSGHVKS